MVAFSLVKHIISINNYLRKCLNALQHHKLQLNRELLRFGQASLDVLYHNGIMKCFLFLFFFLKNKNKYHHDKSKQLVYCSFFF